MKAASQDKMPLQEGPGRLKDPEDFGLIHLWEVSKGKTGEMTTHYARQTVRSRGSAGAEFT
jgi:hypothetical protein